MQDHLLHIGAKNQKNQKKIGLLLGGHIARMNGFVKQEYVFMQSLKDADTEYRAFSDRQSAERNATPHRLQRLAEEVQQARTIAQTAQAEYRDLVQRLQA